MEDKSKKCDMLNSFSNPVEFPVSCVCVCAHTFFRLNLVLYFGDVFPCCWPESKLLELLVAWENINTNYP